MERARPQIHRQNTGESTRSIQGLQSIEQDTVEGQPFSCPYAKYDPNRYSHINIHEQDYRNCSTGYYSSIARLKQHLYRVHDRSQRCCPRCWTCFPDDNKLAKHRELRNCEINPCPEEKMTMKQHELVRERVQGKPVQSWFKIYEILFPDDDEPPNSPFAEWVVGEDLRDVFELIERRLPTIMFQAAASRQPALQSQRPTKSTPFPTTAELMLQAISQVKREFTATDERFTSVFANERVEVTARPTMTRQGSGQSQLSRRMQSAALSDSSEESTRGVNAATPRVQRSTDTVRASTTTSRIALGHITPVSTPAPTPASMIMYPQQFGQQLTQPMLGQFSSGPDQFSTIPAYTVAYTTQPFTAPIIGAPNMPAPTRSMVPTSDAEMMARMLSSDEMYDMNRMTWQH